MEHLKKYHKKYPAARWWRFQVLSKFFSVFPPSHRGVCITLYFYDDNDDNGVGGGSGSGGVGGNDDDDGEGDDDNDRALSFDTFANKQARSPHHIRNVLSPDQWA